MGVDCRAVHRTIHFEAFAQEPGRVGRDGKPSVSYLTHVEKDIKNFIHTKDCRCKFLLIIIRSSMILLHTPLLFIIVVVTIVHKIVDVDLLIVIR